MNQFLKAIIKTIILVSVFLMVLGSIKNATAQDVKILNKFDLGKDSLETLVKKIDIDELNLYTEFDGINEYDIIRYDFYKYNKERVKIILFLVNNKLYGVRFYPKDNVNSINQYRQYLSSVYKKYPKDDDTWVTPKVVVHREIDGNFEESFVHYDAKLIIKYPQYREVF